MSELKNSDEIDRFDLRMMAARAALDHALSIESNVVQDRIIRQSVSKALDVVMPYVVIPKAPELEDNRNPLQRFFDATVDFWVDVRNNFLGRS